MPLLRRIGAAPHRRPAAVRAGTAALACVLFLLGICCAWGPPLAAASPPAHPAGAAAPATATVSDKQELQAAFAAARDGDRIALAAGSYGHVKLSDRNFAKALTITSADPAHPAVLETLQLDKVGGVTLTGIEVRGTALPPTGAGWRVMVSGSHDVTIAGLRITGHIPTAADGSSPTAPKLVKTAPIVGYGHDIGLQGDRQPEHRGRADRIRRSQDRGRPDPERAGAPQPAGHPRRARRRRHERCPGGPGGAQPVPRLQAVEAGQRRRRSSGHDPVLGRQFPLRRARSHDPQQPVPAARESSPHPDDLRQHAEGGGGRDRLELHHHRQSHRQRACQRDLAARRQRRAGGRQRAVCRRATCRTARGRSRRPRSASMP